MRHLYTFYAQNEITMKLHYHSAFNQSYMEDNGLSILSIRAKTNQLDFREKKTKTYFAPVNCGKIASGL